MRVFSVQKAKSFQIKISESIKERELGKKPRYIAGVDAAYPGRNIGIGVSILADILNKEIIEVSVTKTKVYVPYIPGLLAYREVPPMVSSLEKLSIKPDVILVDGHGKAHPRKAGIASHIGVILNIPTIGVAKKILVGNIKCFKDRCFLIYDDEIVGAVIDHPPKSKKLYISIGHMITLDEAYDIIMELRKKRGLPYPLNIADSLSKRYARLES